MASHWLGLHLWGMQVREAPAEGSQPWKLGSLEACLHWTVTGLDCITFNVIYVSAHLFLVLLGTGHWALGTGHWGGNSEVVTDRKERGQPNPTQEVSSAWSQDS